MEGGLSWYGVGVVQVHRIKIRAWQMLAILTPFLEEGMVEEANELLDQAIKVPQPANREAGQGSAARRI